MALGKKKGRKATGTMKGPITTRNYRTFLLNVAAMTGNLQLVQYSKTATLADLKQKFAEGYMLDQSGKIRIY